LNSYYAGRVIPLKQRLDEEYMAQAAFFSDLTLLLQTIARVWIAADGPGPATKRKREMGEALRGESGLTAESPPR